MRSKRRQVWLILKAILWLSLLVFIGRQFAHDLQRPELYQRPLHTGWLVLSGLLYVLGQGFSALYWHRLLDHLGVHPPLGATLRAYYIGQLGKYVPGKAWALFLRTSLVYRHVGLGLAVLTAFYEVLTTMAAGVLVAAVLFAGLGNDTGAELNVQTLLHLLWMEQPGEGGVRRSVLVLLSMLLFTAFLLPLHPAIFNRLVFRRSREILAPSTEEMPASSVAPARLPHLRLVYLFEGLAFAAVGWLFLGASFAAALRGILGADWPLLSVQTARLPAIMGLSYVIGFVVVVAPGGLGVREFLLTLLLTPELVGMQGMGREPARAVVVLVVLLLRLVWTAAELITALLCRLTSRAAAS